MRYVETFNEIVTIVAHIDVLPALPLPFRAIDISDYEGDVEVGMRYENGVFVHVEEPEEPVEPEILPVETFEEKMEDWMASKDANDLIILDSVLGVYEEIYAIKEELSKLKTGGITNG